MTECNLLNNTQTRGKKSTYILVTVFLMGTCWRLIAVEDVNTEI